MHSTNIKINFTLFHYVNLKQTVSAQVQMREPNESYFANYIKQLLCRYTQ
jgi:hypothetical protein